MRFKVIVDSKNDRHVHWRLFASGALAGRLCTTVNEHRVLLAALRAGTLRLEVEDREAAEWQWRRLEGLGPVRHAVHVGPPGLYRTACRLTARLAPEEAGTQCPECLAMLTCTEGWVDGGRLLQEALFYCTGGHSVAVIASVNPGIDWAAYIGGAPGDLPEKDVAYHVASHGAKLPVEHARHFFPRLPRRLHRP
jgi:hypothetical protein